MFDLDIGRLCDARTQRSESRSVNREQWGCLTAPCHESLLPVSSSGAVSHTQGVRERYRYRESKREWERKKAKKRERVQFPLWESLFGSTINYYWVLQTPATSFQHSHEETTFGRGRWFSFLQKWINSESYYIKHCFLSFSAISLTHSKPSPLVILVLSFCVIWWCFPQILSEGDCFKLLGREMI
jgi:hypothetical protein